MFRRIALASAIALSSLGLATTAHAQLSETIEFEANVEFECEFSNTQSGILDYDSFPTTVLSSTVGNGQSGSTDLICNGAADLSKDAGQLTGSVLPSSVTYTITSTPDSVVASTLTPINVDLEVDNNGNIIETGEYTFFVTLTAVPN